MSGVLESAILAVLQQLAELSSAFDGVPELRHSFQKRLRKHNTGLLASVLPNVTNVQHSTDHKITPGSDFSSLIRSIPEEGRKVARQVYSQNTIGLAKGH
jgi:hypothetical protein